MDQSTATNSTIATQQTIRIIRTFLDSVQSYQFEQIINNEFEQLKQLTNEIRIFKMKSTYEGEKECNRKKNRYRDIVPYDDTRVILSTNEDDTQSGNDYINASFVHSALDNHYKYIAAQGPSKETIIDFIRMLVQFNIKIVICACNEYEGQKLKCFRYWTDKLNENLNLNKNYYISLKTKPVVFDGLIIRDLVVRNLKHDSNKEFEFTQFHITNWPDHGVPNNIDSIMNTLRLVRHKLNGDFKHISNFLAVHCSAGCGRTGTIIAIDQLWTLLKENKLNDEFSLFKIGYALREQRIAMIQTLSQYQLFAKAVVYLFEEELANQNSTNLLKLKPFPVRPTHSNYDNLSNLTSYQKSNHSQTSSIIRSVSPSNLKQEKYEDDEMFLKPVYTSPQNRRLIVDSNNNNIIESSTPKSPTTKEIKPKSRFTPQNLFNIFTPNLIKSDKFTKSAQSSVSNFPISSTPSTTSSASPTQSNRNDYENISITSKKSNDDSSTLSSSIYLSVNSKSNLTRSLMVTPASKTYLTSKSIQIDSGNNQGANYINLKQITNDSTTSNLSTNKPFNKQSTSPQFPRKLFNESNSSDKMNDLSMSYTESVSEAKNNQNELYLNDASLNKKEPGSVCEFLSNKLEINKQLTKQIEQSDTNIIKSTKNFVLSPNQAKFGSVKQTDLRQANPPLKAELFDSLPTKAVHNEEVPKPPVRRNKKSVKDEETENLTKIELKKSNNFSIKYNKESKNQQPDSSVIFRSSRSNSSTNYDNQNDVDEHYRNAVLIDTNVQKELQSQQQNGKNNKQPQLRVKTQKNVDSNISQTLPSRKSMSSLNNNFEQLNEQSKKKDLNQTVNYQSNQRINHFSHHFNFPYRIQFSKNIDYPNNSNSKILNSSGNEDGKYFLYNNKVKTDFIRNSENLSELNQIKRRSAHLFNL